MKNHCQHSLEADSYAEHLGKKEALEDYLTEQAGTLISQIEDQVKTLSLPILQHFLTNANEDLWDFCLDHSRRQHQQNIEEAEIERQQQRYSANKEDDYV